MGKVYLLLILLLVSAVQGAGFCLNDNSMCFHGSLKDNVVTITVSSSAKGYASIGIGGKSMSGRIDCYVGFLGADSKTTVSQYLSTSHSTPASFNTPDFKSLELDKSIAIPPSHTLKFTFSRSLVSTNTIDKSTNYIWATSEKSGGFLHHDKKGWFPFDFTTVAPLANSTTPTVLNNIDVIPQQGGAVDLNLIFYAHGVLMFIAWSVAPFIGIFIARFMKTRLGHLWFKIHLGVFVIFTGLGTLVAFIIIVYFSEPPYFSNDEFGHKILGLVMLVLLIIQIILGSSIPWWDKAHWWLGRITVLLGIANTYTGIRTFGADTVWQGLFFATIALGFISLFLGQYFIGQDNHIKSKPKQKRKSSIFQSNELFHPRSVSEIEKDDNDYRSSFHGVKKRTSTVHTPVFPPRSPSSLNYNWHHLTTKADDEIPPLPYTQMPTRSESRQSEFGLGGQFKDNQPPPPPPPLLSNSLAPVDIYSQSYAGLNSQNLGQKVNHESFESVVHNFKSPPKPTGLSIDIDKDESNYVKVGGFVYNNSKKRADPDLQFENQVSNNNSRSDFMNYPIAPLSSPPINFSTTNIGKINNYVDQQSVADEFQTTSNYQRSQTQRQQQSPSPRSPRRPSNPEISTNFSNRRPSNPVQSPRQQQSPSPLPPKRPSNPEISTNFSNRRPSNPEKFTNIYNTVQSPRQQQSPSPLPPRKPSNPETSSKLSPQSHSEEQSQIINEYIKTESLPRRTRSRSSPNLDAKPRKSALKAPSSPVPPPVVSSVMRVEPRDFEGEVRDYFDCVVDLDRMPVIPVRRH